MKYSLFKYQTGILYGAVLTFDSISPERGRSTGGENFVVRGAAFEYPTFDDTFLGLILDAAKWVDISAGTGSITTGNYHLQLNSGATAAGVGGIEMLTGHTNIQYEAKVNIPPVTVNPTATVTLFEMQNYIDANNQSNLIVELDNQGDITLRCQVYLSGTLRDEYTVDWTTGVSTFKILRWYNDVYFFANGTQIFKGTHGSTLSGKFRFFVDNRTANYSVANTIVQHVINRPYVAFDNQIVDDLIVVSDTRARGLTPPSIDGKGEDAAYEGLVDISVVSNVTQTQTDFFEYYYLDSLTLLDETQFDFKLSVIDDDTVRTPSLSSKGLGGGK